MIQTIILLIQIQLLLQEFGLQSSKNNTITPYEVYRTRYLDMLAFCQTYNIFEDYQKLITNKLNEKQIEVQNIFDTINMPESIKNLAINK